MRKEFEIKDSGNASKEVHFYVAISYNPKVDNEESEMKAVLFTKEANKLINDFREVMASLVKELGI